MKTKLFLSDVDGTLLKTGTGMPENVAEAARRFVQAGGLFALSTGRPMQAVTALVEALPVNAPCVLCSGALVYDFAQGRAVSVACLDEAVYPLLERVLDTLPGVSATVYTAEGLYNLRVNERLLTRGVYEDRTAPAAALGEIREPIKVLFTCDEPEVLERMGRELIDPAQFEFHAASRHFYELTRRGVCKGTAAQAVCGAVGGQAGCRLFAAGDAPSDLTMRPFCEAFFAPVTAPQQVRDAATRLFPDPAKGGLAEALDSVRSLP